MKSPGELYYFEENGLMVFTEKYLLLRGYCCKNGCRHCPYAFKKHEEAEPDIKDTPRSEPE